MRTDWPSCGLCGERVGVYEPICVEGGDGEPERTAWLKLSGDRAALRIWHAACVDAALEPPAASAPRTAA